MGGRVENRYKYQDLNWHSVEGMIKQILQKENLQKRNDKWGDTAATLAGGIEGFEFIGA